MDNQRSGFRYRNASILIIFVFFLAAYCILPVMADDSTTLLGVIPAKSDIANLAFVNQPAGYYYFKFDQVGGGGINAMHISSTDIPSDTQGHIYGDVTTTTSQTGTFYITDTGGRGYQDEAVLLVAVKGNISSNFAIHIKSSGYSWIPDGTMNKQPDLTQITYHSGAVDDTYTKSQFVYGPQTWKPAGNNVPSDYPLYYGEDTTDTTNTFKLMFVDLKAGPLGPNGVLDVNTLNDKGAVKVEYTITNLDTVATFNIYGYNDNTTQGHGISWSNGLTSGGSVPSAVSGYTVLGTNYLDRASEFPTSADSTPVYHPPVTNFTANVTTGSAPLPVQFTDTTVQSVKNWAWDFGDGSASTDTNPVHTFATAGSYTVSLTATNNQGLAATKTQTITVTSSGSTGGSAGAGGGGSESNGAGNSLLSFTANVTSGSPPLAVQFNGTSSVGNISRWVWDFTGDNIPESLVQNPVFVFNKTGNYSVSLTINTTEGKIFNFTQMDFIRVTANSTTGGDTWISSDQYDPVQSPAVSDLQQPARSITTMPTQSTGSYSPFGKKVAETLLDAVIVVGVVGAGVILWKKL